jgi:CRP-like cAMP-binding protein
MIAIMSAVDATLFRALGARERALAAGQTLFRRDDPVVSVHAVLAGEVRLVRHRSDGGLLVLQRARTGTLLAEASLFAATTAMRSLPGRHACSRSAATHSKRGSRPIRD